MTLKVAHVVRQYYPSVGGLEDVVKSIATHQLRQHGCSPRIITLNRLFRNSAEKLKAEEILDGVPVLRLPYFGSSRYPVCPSVLKHVMDVDLIHVHGIDFFFDYLAVTKPIHRRPMIATTHGIFFHTRFLHSFKKAYFGLVTRMSCRAYDKVIAISGNDARFFKQIAPSSKINVIENGVDTEKYWDTASATLAPVIICFGRWSENKGLPEMIEFFKCLVAQDSRWKLVLAGREYDYDEKKLMALISKHGIQDNVQLVPNPAREQLTELIQKSSYFMSLSRSEGFGLAAVEAMSAGLTPLLSEIPVFQKLIKVSRAGIILAGNDNQAKSKLLLDLHQKGESDYARRRMLSLLFSKKYSWEDSFNRYMETYAEILQK